MWKTMSGGPNASAIQSPSGGGGDGPGGVGGWHPTVLYLVALVLLEILAVGWLSRAVLK